MEKQERDSDSLKEILKKHLNVDYPITGGKGKSIEDAIIIECETESEGVKMENDVVAGIMKMNNKKGRLFRQYLLNVDNKNYDVMEYVLDDEPDKIQSYYFDISKFYGKY